MPDYACAQCGNTDVRKVSAVYNEGSWTSTTSGQSTGFRRDKDGKWRPRTDHYTEQKSGKTRLAEMLTPPREPMGIAGLAILALIALLALCWFVSAQILQPLVGVMLGRIGGVIVALMALGYLFDPVMRFEQKQAKRHEEARDAWEKRMKNWESLLYCDRCDQVTHPDTGKSASPRSMSTLL